MVEMLISYFVYSYLEKYKSPNYLIKLKKLCMHFHADRAKSKARFYFKQN